MAPAYRRHTLKSAATSNHESATNEWLMFDKRVFTKKLADARISLPKLHEWRKPNDVVWFEIWESDPGQGITGRKHDFLFVKKISRKDLLHPQTLSSHGHAQAAVLRKLVKEELATFWGSKPWPPEWLYQLVPGLEHQIGRVRQGVISIEQLSQDANVPKMFVRLRSGGVSD